MGDSFISGPTLDDLMRFVVERIRSQGNVIHPTKGGLDGALELIGVVLELENPRARLSRTETRGKPYSCLGELCWYLAGSNQPDFVSYYIAEYKRLVDNGVIFGAYGPRLFDWDGIKQLTNVRDLLTRKHDSRRAVIQLFDRYDILEEYKDIPCTCTLQFMRRGDKLHMFTSMRSNDAYKGLPHDLFCFTMLQEIMARALGLDIGVYKHAIGSLHIYAKDLEVIQQFLNEGWQPTIDVAMPEMPKGDPWPAINLLLKVESAIRTTGMFDEHMLTAVDPYWGDLMRLLHVFAYKRHKNKEGRAIDKIREMRDSMASKIYLPFVDKVLREF